MKKTYEIFRLNNESKLEKFYRIGFENSFLTKEQAIWGLTSSTNSRFFNENEEYTVLPVYIKTQTKPEIKDGF